LHRERILWLRSQHAASLERARGYLVEETHGEHGHLQRSRGSGGGGDGDGGEGRRGEGQSAPGGPQVGDLLRRLQDGSLTLSVPLARTEALRLYDKLQAMRPQLASAEAALAHADLARAATEVSGLLPVARATAATVLDEVRGIEVALGCCTIDAVRPRSYPMRSIGVLLLVAGAVWAAVLRLTAPSPGRAGQRVARRPGGMWGFGKSSDGNKDL
jgi:hypothetical protein